MELCIQKLNHEEELSIDLLRTETWVLLVYLVAPCRHWCGIRKHRDHKQTGRLLTASPLWAHTTCGWIPNTFGSRAAYCHATGLPACVNLSVAVLPSSAPLVHIFPQCLAPSCFSASLMNKKQLKIKCDTLYINNRFNLNCERRDESSRAGRSYRWWTYSSQDVNVEIKHAKLKLWHCDNIKLWFFFCQIKVYNKLEFLSSWMWKKKEWRCKGQRQCWILKQLWVQCHWEKRTKLINNFKSKEFQKWNN